MVRKMQPIYQWTSALLPPLNLSVGKQTSGFVDGRSEWGGDGSSVRAREDRLKDGLKKWKKGDRLFLVNELLALLSNSSPSLQNGI